VSLFYKLKKEKLCFVLDNVLLDIHESLIKRRGVGSRRVKPARKGEKIEKLPLHNQ